MAKRLAFGLVICALTHASLAVAAGDSTPVGLGHLTDWQQELVDKAYAYLDSQWDEDEGMWILREDPWSRGTIFYAAGLLLRGEEGDTARAERAIRSVLAMQYKAPGKPWHGGYMAGVLRNTTVDHSQPPTHYDENLREFIGTAQIFALETCGGKLSSELKTDMLAAIRLACEGAHARDVRPHYTNIALMSAYVLAWGGCEFDEPAWKEHGDTMARTVHERFQRHDTFDEYNSPTYYGVDFLALGMWRRLPVSDEMAAMGREMDAGLWRDVARFFHAGLHNMCGPYDRCYNMDMNKYDAPLGHCIALAGGAPRSVYSKDPRGWFELGFFPMLAALGMAPPEEVKPHLKAFGGPRRIERNISTGPLRVAQAIMEERFMVGVERFTGPSRTEPQFKPVTMHWRAPDDSICWLRMMPDFFAHPRLEGRTVWVEVASIGGKSPKESLRFEIYAPGIDAGNFSPETWQLPGLRLDIDSTLGTPEVEVNGHVANVRFPAGRQGVVALTVEPVDGAEAAPQAHTMLLSDDAYAQKRDEMAILLRQKSHPVETEPLFVRGDAFRRAAQRIEFHNPSELPLEFEVEFQGHPDVSVRPARMQLVLDPNESRGEKVRLRAPKKVPTGGVDPIPGTVTMTYTVPGDEAERRATQPLTIVPLKARKIPHVAEPKTVDGRLDDWDALSVVCESPAELQFDKESWQGSDDGSFQFGLAYDGDYLYLAAAVRDDEIKVQEGAYPWEQDSLEIRVLAEDEPMRSRCRGKGEFERIMLVAIAPGQTEANLYCADKLPESVKAVCLRGESGYVVELAVPAAYLDEQQGKPWEALRLNMTMNDYDADGASQLWWRPDWRSDGTYAGSGTFVKK